MYSLKGEQKVATYYLIIENFDRFSSHFEFQKVEARSIKDAVVGYLDGDYFDDEELTIEGENGRYVGEEHTIGIGITEEAAALQYVKSRKEMS